MVLELELLQQVEEDQCYHEEEHNPESGEDPEEDEALLCEFLVILDVRLGHDIDVTVHSDLTGKSEIWKDFLRKQKCSNECTLFGWGPRRGSFSVEDFDSTRSAEAMPPAVEDSVDPFVYGDLAFECKLAQVCARRDVVSPSFFDKFNYWH